MIERKYLPTFAELVDRLSIVQLKMIFIPEHREAYIKERALIEDDIDGILDNNYLCAIGFLKPSQLGDGRLCAADIRAIMMIMLANRFIWENESKARQGGPEQDALLKATHSVNGVRNASKNILARRMGERIDSKVDCLAADLPTWCGNWNVFEDVK